jgi:hypothetical protein
MKRPMTDKRYSDIQLSSPGEKTWKKEWNKRPDGFTIKMSTTEKVGEFVILEFKRMSCVTDQYVTRTRNVAVAQYASKKSALERTLGPLGWLVSQRSFIEGARSLYEQDLHDN